MSKRSPSGIHLPIIDQRYDQRPTETLVLAGTISLTRDEMIYLVVKTAAPLAGSTTVLLPPDPSDGDEVVISSLAQFVDPATQFLVIDGNGHNIGVQPTPAPTYNANTVVWVKFNKIENIWLMLTCCIAGEEPFPDPPIVLLGAACDFGVLGASAVTASTAGTFVVGGDVGSDPTDMGPFAPGVVIPPNVEHPVVDAATTAARAAAIAARAALLALPAVPGTDLSPVAGNTVVPPGVYDTAAIFDMTLGSNLILDGGGDPDASWVFRVGSLLTAAGTNVVLVDGAQSKNVFWVTDTTVTLGASSTMAGTMLVGSAFTSGANVAIEGRVLVTGAGAVTFSGDTAVNTPECDG